MSTPKVVTVDRARVAAARRRMQRDAKIGRATPLAVKKIANAKPIRIAKVGATKSDAAAVTGQKIVIGHPGRTAIVTGMDPASTGEDPAAGEDAEPPRFNDAEQRRAFRDAAIQQIAAQDRPLLDRLADA